ncbi:hypothetical protein SLEP1_g60057, partial [Rubroshorea leprosula]
RSSGSNTKGLEKRIPVSGTNRQLVRQNKIGRRPGHNGLGGLVLFAENAVVYGNRLGDAILQEFQLLAKASATTEKLGLTSRQLVQGRFGLVELSTEFENGRLGAFPLGSGNLDIARFGVGPNTLQATTGGDVHLAHQFALAATGTLRRHNPALERDLLGQTQTTDCRRNLAGTRHGGRKIVARTQLKEEGGVVLRATPCTIITKLMALTGDTGVTDLTVYTVGAPVT